MDKVSHFEIPANDFARARSFYQGVFDWQISEVPGMEEYQMVSTVETDKQGMPKSPGGINGGIFKKTAGETPIVVIEVANIDQALGRVEQAGGKVLLEKQEVGDFGLYARFADTEGNVLGIWQTLKR